MLFHKRLLCHALMLTAGLSLCSCASMGPRVLPTNREGFNSALLSSDEQQLLLNITRLRYEDRPYFLDVSSVTTSGSLALSSNSSFTASGSSGSSAPTTKSFSATSLFPGVAFTDVPTVMYSPLQGEKFIKQILTPIGINNASLLMESGWSPARIFRIIIQTMGPLENGTRVTRPFSSHVPEYKEFINFVHDLYKYEVNNDLAFSIVNLGGQTSIRLQASPSFQVSHKYKKALDLLGIVGRPKSIFFVDKTISSKVEHKYPDSAFLTIRTRSFMGVLYYLSKSVEVTQEDKDKGIVGITLDSKNNEFDWREVTKNIIQVKNSSEKPKNSNIAIQYRDRWYYIEDSDLSSKETFALVSQLFSLMAGDPQKGHPVLTISSAG